MRTGRVHLWRDDWPLDVYVRFGCGFVPATRLMARIGRDVELSLVEELPVRGVAESTIRLAARDDVDEAANEISSRILAHDLTVARSLASVDLMASALRDRSLTPPDVEMELLPILLAAGNRGEQAVALLQA